MKKFNLFSNFEIKDISTLNAEVLCKRIYSVNRQVFIIGNF